MDSERIPEERARAVYTEPATVRCRPGLAPWFLFTLLGLIGGLGVALPGATAGAQDTASRWLFWCYGAALLLPDIALLGWLLRAQIVADANGLRWRGLGRWRRASWAEVSDYYEKAYRAQDSWTIIETSAGTLKLTPQGWFGGIEPLRRAVERCATSARAKIWGVLGTRPEELWPLIFQYHRADQRTAAIVFWLCSLPTAGYAVYLLTPPHLRGAVEIVSGLGWPLGLVGAIGWLGFALMLPAMVLPLGLTLAEIRRRRDHRIVVEAEGLLFEGSGRLLAAKWTEVTDYFVARLSGRLSLEVRSVVITARGSLDFTPSLRDAALLERVIAHRAKSALAKDWRAHTGEVLGGEASRRVRDAHGRDERIYHYRTRTNRALLWLPTSIALTFALFPMLAAQVSIPMDAASDRMFGLCGGVIGLATIWGWWRYHHASVRIGSRGITRYGWRGHQFIAWEQVRDYYQLGDDAIIVGQDERIRLWLGIGDAEELKDEVARRAIFSQTKEWKTGRPDRRRE